MEGWVAGVGVVEGCGVCVCVRAHVPYLSVGLLLLLLEIKDNS